MQEGIELNTELIALVAFVLCVIAVVLVIINRLIAFLRKPEDFTLSASQKFFYGSLCQLSARRAIVLSHVRVTQFSNFKPKCSKWSASYRKLNAQKFDFVLCRSRDLKPVAVIEFEGDKSSNTISADMETICSNNQLAVCRIPASAVAKLDEMDKLLFPGEVARFVRLDNGFQVPARYHTTEESVKG